MDLFGFRRRRLIRLARDGAARLLATKVKDIMTDYVVTIAPEKSVVDAASVMVGEDVSALVVEQDAKPVGVLTERDFITKVPLSDKVFGLTVKDIMSEPLATIRPEATLTDVRDLLRQKHIRKLIVSGADGRIAGIVTQTDLSRRIYEDVLVVPRLSDAAFFVRDVMTKKVVSAPQTVSFAEAKRLMTRSKVSALPVTEKGAYVGIFTEYDVVTQFYDAGGKLQVKELPALLKSPIKVIPAGISIFDANTIMLFEKVRRLLVVDEKKVVGIVTQTDLVHACLDYAQRAVERLSGDAEISEDGLVALYRSHAIISEYAGEHLRAFTMR